MAASNDVLDSPSTLPENSHGDVSAAANSLETQNAQISEKWGLFIALIFLSLPFLLIIPLFLWVSVGPLILCLYGLILYLAFPNREHIGRWFITHFALLVTIFIFALLSNALWLWLLTNFFWASDDSSERQKISRVDDSFTLEAHYAPTFFGNGQIFPIHLKLHNLKEEEQTIPLTLTLPPDQPLISLVNPKQTFNLTAASGEVVTQSIWLQNEAAVGLRHTTVLTITHEPTTVSLPLPIQVETPWGYRLRVFANSTVNQASPLILLLAALTPGVAIFIQQEINKREALLKERQKEEAETLVEELKGYLRTENLVQAELTLNRLKTTPYREHARLATQIADRLLALSKGDNESKSHVENGKSWPDECIACYLLAQRNLENNPDNHLKQLLNEARYHLPLNEVQQTHLLDRLAQIEEVGAAVIQPRRWAAPFPLTLPGPSRPPESALAPFAWDRAEDDSYYLFHPDARRTTFYGNSLFRSLLDAETNAIVWSTPGSGRTALAMALTYWSEREKSTLTLFSPGPITVGRMQMLGSQRLMDFICRHPTHLTLSSETERVLLANILVTGLGKDAARAIIKRTLVQLDETPWLNEEQDRDRRRNWRQLARTQLQFMDKMLHQAVEQKEISPHWVNEWVACACALRFDAVRLVLDCQGEDLPWLKEAIWPNLYEWQSVGLYVTMFVPERARPQLPPANPITLIKRLTWDKEQFYNLLRHRYRAFFPSRRQPLEACFAEDTLLDRLIAHCQRQGTYHPRRFNQIWSKIVGQQSINELQISRAMIEQASRTVSW